MNPNPYPTGRWTPRRKAACSSTRPESESLHALRQAPLRELFWGLPESKLLDEARERLECALLAALRTAPEESVLQSETFQADRVVEAEVEAAFA